MKPSLKKLSRTAASSPTTWRTVNSDVLSVGPIHEKGRWELWAWASCGEKPWVVRRSGACQHRVRIGGWRSAGARARGGACLELGPGGIEKGVAGSEEAEEEKRRDSERERKGKLGLKPRSEVGQ